MQVQRVGLGEEAGLPSPYSSAAKHVQLLSGKEKSLVPPKGYTESLWNNHEAVETAFSVAQLGPFQRRYGVYEQNGSSSVRSAKRMKRLAY